MGGGSDSIVKFKIVHQPVFLWEKIKMTKSVEKESRVARGSGTLRRAKEIKRVGEMLKLPEIAYMKLAASHPMDLRQFSTNYSRPLLFGVKAGFSWNDFTGIDS